jgi:hypothetical protein
MAEIQVSQGEAQTLPFRIKNKTTGAVLDLTGATFLLWVKRDLADTEPIFTKEDSDFDKAGIAVGYVTVPLAAYDTYQPPGTYAAELRIIQSDGTIEKLRFDLKILQAVTPNDWTLAPTGIVSLEAFGTPVIT